MLLSTIGRSKNVWIYQFQIHSKGAHSQLPPPQKQDIESFGNNLNLQLRSVQLHPHAPLCLKLLPAASTARDQVYV